MGLAMDKVLWTNGLGGATKSNQIIKFYIGDTNDNRIKQNIRNTNN